MTIFSAGEKPGDKATKIRLERACGTKDAVGANHDFSRAIGGPDLRDTYLLSVLGRNNEIGQIRSDRRCHMRAEGRYPGPTARHGE